MPNLTRRRHYHGTKIIPGAAFPDTWLSRLAEQQEYDGPTQTHRRGRTEARKSGTADAVQQGIRTPVPTTDANNNIFIASLMTRPSSSPTVQRHHKSTTAINNRILPPYHPPQAPSYPSIRTNDQRPTTSPQGAPRSALKHQPKRALPHDDDRPDSGDIHTIPSCIHDLLCLRLCSRLRTQYPRAQCRRLLAHPSAQRRCPQGRFASPRTPCCTSCPRDAARRFPRAA